MKRVHALILTAACSMLSASAFAQNTPEIFSLGKTTTQSGLPLSNSAIEFLIRGDSVWVGGGKGLDLTTDAGATWRHFGDEAPFANATSPFHGDDIAALDGFGPVLWASLAGSEKFDDGSRVPRGEGLAYSSDNGASWQRIPQPMENTNDSTIVLQYGANRIKALAITTAINNITYDIAVTRTEVWIASFAGGLRRSADGGKTFSLVVLPPDNLDSISINDTLSMDLSPVDRPDFWNMNGTQKGMRGSLNHRVFSVLAVNDSVIWVGTAGGVNKTTNGGRSWRKFSYANQQSAISGNFIVALGRNIIDGREHIWASTINALEPREFRAVSFTSDGGNTWTTALRGEFTNNFGFQDSIVYAATSSGVFRSDDAGVSWMLQSVFVDPVSRNRITDPRCYAAASQGNRVWLATADGLVTTIDAPGGTFGRPWTILRAAAPLASNSSVYAYPNPFSPAAEVCRVRYHSDAGGQMSIRVYDFAMYPVRTLLSNAGRPPNADLDEIWDGKNDDGTQVANGLYYIQVKAGDGDAMWTKVVVLQ